MINFHDLLFHYSSETFLVNLGHQTFRDLNNSPHWNIAGGGGIPEIKMCIVRPPGLSEKCTS